jgi:polysaccharide biosynthesis transport protein
MLPTGSVAPPSYNFAEEPLGSNERDSVNSDAIIWFIRKNWCLCFIWILASLCAGIAFLLLAPGYYTASTTILLEDRARPSDATAGVLVTDPAYVDNQVQVLQSDEVIGRVIDQHRLMQTEEVGRRGGLARFIPGLVTQVSPAPTTASRLATAMRVKRALMVRQVGTSSAIEIRFTSQDPLGAAAIANAIAQSYIEGQLELKRKARQDAATGLQKWLTELRARAFAIGSSPQDSLPTTPEAEENARARLREQQNTAETYRLLYNSFLQRRYAETADLSIPTARAITLAEVPIDRSWPQIPVVLAIAAVGGAAAGIGHAWLRAVTKVSLRTVEDVRQSTSLDRIAGVSKISKRRWQTAISAEEGLQPVYLKTSTSLYDALGKVAARLQTGQSQRSGLIIAVAAPTRGAGASSVAAHLAGVIAESGQKTVLVDANWRKPSAAKAMLKAEPSRKLARALVTVHLQLKSFDVLLLRPTSPISELNASLSIATTLQHLQPLHDCVVVDFHSAEQAADLEVSMHVVKQVIVVVEARRTTSERLRDFLRYIPKDKLATVVLNKV